MKILIIVLVVLSVHSAKFSGQNSSENCDHSAPQFNTKLAENLNFIINALIETQTKCAYNEDSPISDFVYFYYKKSGYNYYQKLSEYQISQRVNQSLPTYIIFHGIKGAVGDIRNGWMRATGDKILEYIDANVILIDYRSVSNCNYIFLSTNWIFKLSKYIADCVIEKWNLSPNQIKIIGHSLGGHIAGLIGSYLKGEVEEIIALDPAGPGFDGQYLGIRQNTLNSSCAQFVQVIHTNPMYLGSYKHWGDCDFFANILLPEQPGCVLFDFICSHFRACELFYASMFPENKFIGKKGPLSRNQVESSRFGFFNDRKNGSFYFNTTPCFAYALDQ